MAEQEYVYVGGGLPVTDVAGLLAAALELRMVQGEEPGEWQLLGPTAGADDATTDIWVQPNEEPGDVADGTAGYGVEVSVRVIGTEEHQSAEAQRVLGALLDARPEVPVLVTHDGVFALAAYLPGKGVHEFAAGTEVGPEYVDEWRPWVPAGRD